MPKRCNTSNPVRSSNMPSGNSLSPLLYRYRLCKLVRLSNMPSGNALSSLPARFKSCRFDRPLKSPDLSVVMPFSESDNLVMLLRSVPVTNAQSLMSGS